MTSKDGMTSKEWLAEHVRQLVETAPPLPQEAREVIRRLFRPTLDESGPPDAPGRVA